MVHALSNTTPSPDSSVSWSRQASLEAPLAWLAGLAALAFPSSCLLCRRAIEEPLDGPACRACLDALPIISGPSCPRCGLPFEPSVTPGLCGPCRSPSRRFRLARSLHPFTDPVRECVHAIKYGGRRRLGQILGRRAGRMWLESESSSASTGRVPVEAVVPVPLSRARRRERGYNQAEIIARAVSSSTGLPFKKRALTRVRERPPQTGLTGEQRRRNVAGVFRARQDRDLMGRAVLLVDDVLTTGATVDAATRSLLRAGVAAVDVLTLARVP